MRWEHQCCGIIHYYLTSIKPWLLFPPCYLCFLRTFLRLMVPVSWCQCGWDWPRRPQYISRRGSTGPGPRMSVCSRNYRSSRTRPHTQTAGLPIKRRWLITNRYSKIRKFLISGVLISGLYSITKTKYVFIKLKRCWILLEGTVCFLLTTLSSTHVLKVWSPQTKGNSAHVSLAMSPPRAFTVHRYTGTHIPVAQEKELSNRSLHVYQNTITRIPVDHGQ